MNDRRYNGDTMNDNSAVQCREYSQIKKPLDFLHAHVLQ